MEELYDLICSQGWNYTLVTMSANNLCSVHKYFYCRTRILAMIVVDALRFTIMCPVVSFT